MVVALKARLVALGHFIVPKKRLGIVGFAIVLILAVVLWGSLTDFTFAQASQMAAAASDGPGWIATIVSSVFFWIASLFIRLAIFILSFIIEIAGYNGFIDARAVNYGWVMVRDLANMFFVVILLLIAFGTILGIEQYEWKKMLVKLVFAAILVNFSRIICALIIDVAQVIMITFVNAIAATAGGNFINAFGLEKVLQISRLEGAELTDGEVMIASVAAVGFSVSAMAVMAVFLVILLGRMITLWVAIIFSPLAFVFNVIPQTQKYASQWWSEFNNNVIVGPVVVFFLWLSFVTVGGGDIHTEVSQSSSSPSKLPTSEGETFEGGDNVGGESAGLSRAMHWNQMANFAIALGILLVGAKVAGQLGATGSSALQKAANLGVKAAALAGGVVAARWAYKKGVLPAAKATGKFVGMNLLGGNMVKRTGQKIGYRANRLWNKQKEWRDEKASGLTGKGFWGRQGAKLIRTGSFADREVEDWKKAAASQKEITEKAISTSKLKSGKAKLKLATQLKASEARAKGKTDQKEADETNRLMTRGEVAVLEEEYEKNQEMLKKGEDGKGGKLSDDGRAVLEGKQTLNEERRKRLREQYKREQKEEMGNVGYNDRIYGQRMQAGAVGKAGAEYISKGTTQQEELAVAIAKDKVLVDRGEKPRFEAGVRQSHAEDLEKQLSALNFREITKRSSIYADELAKETAKEMKKPEKERDATKIRQLSAVSLATLAANMKKGAENGLTAMDGAAKSVSFNEELGAEDFKGMQRKIMSIMLGRNITKGKDDKETDTNIAEAFKELQGLHGDKQLNVMLRSLDESLKKAAGDHAPILAGVFNDRDVSDTGEINFQLETDAKESKITKEYWAGEVTPGKVHTLGGMVTNTNGKVTENAGNIGKGSQDNFAMIFGRMTRGTQLDPRLVQEWAGLKDGVKKALLDALRSRNPEAATNFELRITGSKDGHSASSSPQTEAEEETENGNGATT